ncbi:hypothetical protein ASU33_12255 [Solirubrum puertoriconensis]|uniref:Uncharacterized protein n=1 Tax=Solirubrum puertoriconensis TaxID=1751427 RepID=A0A9X0HMR9_SOLP1|nr:hypothetical protein ASU33_12255 [Solirubrum puertoriconensis]
MVFMVFDEVADYNSNANDLGGTYCLVSRPGFEWLAKLYRRHRILALARNTIRNTRLTFAV